MCVRLIKTKQAISTSYSAFSTQQLHLRAKSVKLLIESKNSTSQSKSSDYKETSVQNFSVGLIQSPKNSQEIVDCEIAKIQCLTNVQPGENPSKIVEKCLKICRSSQTAVRCTDSAQISQPIRIGWEFKRREIQILVLETVLKYSLKLKSRWFLFGIAGAQNSMKTLGNKDFLLPMTTRMEK